MQKKSSVLTMLTTSLSVFCIGLGIISIIASNWQQIPDWLKLTADILLLCTNATAVYYACRFKKNWLSPAIILYALLIAASIGLVAQVFQLSSNNISAVTMLWCLLSAPLLFINASMVLPFFWLPLVSFSIYDIFIADWLSLQDYFFQALMVNTGYLFAWALLYRIATFFIAKQHGFLRAFRFWIVFGIICSFIGLGLLGRFSVPIGFFSEQEPDFYAKSSLFLAVVWGSIFWLNQRQKQSFLLPATLILLGLYNISIAVFHLYNNLLGFGVTIAALAILAAYAYLNNRTRLLMTATILMAVRIFILFLDVFGSLMSTGVILICSGVFLIASIKIIKTILSVTEGKSHE